MRKMNWQSSMGLTSKSASKSPYLPVKLSDFDDDSVALRRGKADVRRPYNSFKII